MKSKAAPCASKKRTCSMPPLFRPVAREPALQTQGAADEARQLLIPRGPCRVPERRRSYGLPAPPRFDACHATDRDQLVACERMSSSTSGGAYLPHHPEIACTQHTVPSCLLLQSGGTHAPRAAAIVSRAASRRSVSQASTALINGLPYEAVPSTKALLSVSRRASRRAMGYLQGFALSYECEQIASF